MSPPPFFLQPMWHLNRLQIPRQPPPPGPTCLQSGPLQPKSSCHGGGFTGHRIHRRGSGTITGGGITPAIVVLAGEVEVPGRMPAIIGPSDGPVGKIASAQAELFVAVEKTSDNGLKLCRPDAQHEPYSLLQPFSFAHSDAVVPLFEISIGHHVGMLCNIPSIHTAAALHIRAAQRNLRAILTIGAIWKSLVALISSRKSYTAKAGRVLHFHSAGNRNLAASHVTDEERL